MAYLVILCALLHHDRLHYVGSASALWTSSAGLLAFAFGCAPPASLLKSAVNTAARSASFCSMLTQWPFTNSLWTIAISALAYLALSLAINRYSQSHQRPGQISESVLRKRDTIF